jgi:hypothetical protein
MTAVSHDLWPADLFGSPATTPPVAILRQQGALLNEKTNGLLEGVVLSGRRDSELHYQFYIRAPLLENYAYLLFEVIHSPILFYPLVVKTDLTEQGKTVASEEQFRQVLRDLFSSERSKEVIRSLLAQSKELTA